MPRPDALLTALSRFSTPTAAELQGALGVSKATLSRLVAEAGEEVRRLGRARATRYSRTRAIPGLGRVLPLYRVTETGTVLQEGALHLLFGGGHWLQPTKGDGTLFEGLPPFAADMAPQGYLGRGFSKRHEELGLPARLSDWTDDHRLLALGLRGEDCVGDLILGDESLKRHLTHDPSEVSRPSYPELALRSGVEDVGSSAGGEHPKFAVFSEGRHVLVKFASGEGEAAQRWRDLLWCEWQALTLLRGAGFEASRATWFDLGSHRFLEVERFDRVRLRGRRGVLSLAAIDNEYFGQPDNWTLASQRLVAEGRLKAEEARTVRLWDVFGELIGNTDRHFGNLSFFTQPGDSFKLAPAYDMLPMALAPAQTALVDRPFTPRAPNAANFDVWPEAADLALKYWQCVADNPALHASVHRFTETAAATITTLLRRLS